MLLTFDFKTIEEAKEFLAGLVAKPKEATVGPGWAGHTPPPAEEIPTGLPPPGAVTKFAAFGPVVFAAPPDTVLATSGSGVTVFAVPPGSGAAVNAPVVQPKKRGRPAKVAEAKEYGIEDCRTALSNLFDTKGREAAKAALAEFKAARVTDLKPAQYRGFVVLCETLGQPE